MKDNTLSIVSPWVELFRKIEAFFKKDPDVRVEYNNDTKIIKMFIDSQDKYVALSRVMPPEKVFGNVTLKIQLIPANYEELSAIELFRRAFKDNPAVEDIIAIEREKLDTTNDFSYIVCKKEVVQYHNDTLGDPHGNCSTLYENIARDIFNEQGGVYFCTATE